MQRPLFGDYAKQLLGAIVLKNSVVSQGRCFTFADRPMLLLMQLIFAAAMLVAYNYSPFSNSRDVLPVWIAVLITLLLLAAYWLFFVCRFARFSVQWEDPALSSQPAAEDQDGFGNFLETPPARRRAWKSRRMFALLALALAGVTAAYCILGFGLAPRRLYNNHKESLDRLAEIAEEYEQLYIDTPQTFNEELFVGGIAFSDTYDDDGYLYAYEPSEVTIQEISSIISSFHNGYIRHISKYTESSLLYVSLNARWGRGCDLIWSPEQVPEGTIAAEFSDTCYRDVSITQLDAHWWMVWYDFDTGAY